MKMGFRWYGEGNDTVSLDDIRQIPGVETVVWSLHHKQAGEVWEEAEIAAEMAHIAAISAEATARRRANKQQEPLKISFQQRCSG